MAAESLGKRQISDIIHLRSRGETISQTAYRLGLAPWHISYISRFLKVCVSSEELMWIEEEAEANGFGTVGEFVMDVFNRTYEEFYKKASRKKKSA